MFPKGLPRTGVCRKLLLALLHLKIGTLKLSDFLNELCLTSPPIRLALVTLVNDKLKKASGSWFHSWFDRNPC